MPRPAAVGAGVTSRDSAGLMMSSSQLLAWALDYISDADGGAASDRLVRHTLRYLVETADATALEKVRADHAAYYALPAARESGHIDRAPTDPREFAVDVIAGDGMAHFAVRSVLKHFIATGNDAGIRAVYGEDQRQHLDRAEDAAATSHTRSVECGYCSAPAGRRCVSNGGLATDPHGARMSALEARTTNDLRSLPAPRAMDQGGGR